MAFSRAIDQAAIRRHWASKADSPPPLELVSSKA
jgi:hypothetical protein